MRYLLRLLFLIMLCINYNNFSQNSVQKCATVTSTQLQESDKKTRINLIKQSTNLLSNTITYVPIRANIIRKTDGTGGITLSSLNSELADANIAFLNSSIQFYFCGTVPNYINNTTFYNFVESDEFLLTSPNDINNAINLYIPGIAGYCGKSYLPLSNNLNNRNRVFVKESCLGSRVLSHELGHYFDLLHTFDISFGNELVTRGIGSNCTVAGDLLCDTQADPDGFTDGGCNYGFNTVRDTNGDAYTPLVDNIMSYYPCIKNFTTGQFDRMKDGLLLRKTVVPQELELRYTLDCPSTPVLAPSNVFASMNGINSTITWTDNSINEMGFIIERSIFPTTGFVTIGGVAPNITTFTDNSVITSSTYYYRIKASNSTTNYSNSASLVTPSCPVNLILVNPESSGIRLYQASNTIISTSIIYGGSNITYRAATKIVLNQGFQAGQAVFKATIQPCTNGARESSNQEVAKLLVNEEIEGIELSAYPNPTSNGEVIIQYTLPEDGNASISLANMSGINIKNIVEDKFHEKGTYKVRATVSDLKTGIYLYILQGNKVRLAKKLIVE